MINSEIKVTTHRTIRIEETDCYGEFLRWYCEIRPSRRLKLLSIIDDFIQDVDTTGIEELYHD